MMMNLFKIYELLPRKIRTPEEQAKLCLDDEFGNNSCAEQLFELFGYNEAQLDKVSLFFTNKSLILIIRIIFKN